MLYEKLSNEFKDRLIIIRKTENLNNLILLLYNMDANMMKINKQSQVCIKPNASNFPAIKPLFKSYNSAPIKPFTTIGIAIVFSIFSIATGTHPGSIDVFKIIR